MQLRFLGPNGAVLLATGLVLSGCGGSDMAPTGGGGGGTTTTTANVTVSIVGLTGSQAFSPNPVSVTVGQTLAFRNATNELHHIIQDGGGFDSGEIRPGQTSSLVPSAGANPMTSLITIGSGSAIAFHCTIHPSMVGSINGTVTAPAGGGASDGGSGGDTTGTDPNY